MATATPEVTFTPADAVTFALADAGTVSEERRCYLRYIFTDGKEASTAAVLANRPAV